MLKRKKKIYQKMLRIVRDPMDWIACYNIIIISKHFFVVVTFSNESNIIHSTYMLLFSENMNSSVYSFCLFFSSILFLVVLLMKNIESQL